MNNLNKEFALKEELLSNLNWLYFNDIDRFNFIKVLTESVVNKMPISISMSLNKDIYNVSVTVGDYMHKEDFSSIERANGFIDMIRSVNENY